MIRRWIRRWLLTLARAIARRYQYRLAAMAPFEDAQVEVELLGLYVDHSGHHAGKRVQWAMDKIGELLVNAGAVSW